MSRVPGASAVGRGLSGVLSIDPCLAVGRPACVRGSAERERAAPDDRLDDLPAAAAPVDGDVPDVPRARPGHACSCSVLAKLYPVALIAGAVLLPVLVVLYMVDVNVFEEQSLPVIGAHAGVGTGRPARVTA